MDNNKEYDYPISFYINEINNLLKGLAQRIEKQTDDIRRYEVNLDENSIEWCDGTKHIEYRLNVEECWKIGDDE